MADETKRLFELLNAEETQAETLSSRLGEYSIESKDEVVARAACTLEPPLGGRLLERLPNLLNEHNRADMDGAFIANLSSPDPEAREYSLRGLAQLGHEALADFALLSLRDDDGEVVYAACQILLPNARQDVRVWKTLQALSEARKNQQEFRSTLDLLKAQGFERPAAGKP